jgi:hypothetical protein
VRDAQAEAGAARGPLQLLDALDARAGVRGVPPNAVQLPPGFLEELSAKFEANGDAQGLQDLVVPVGERLAIIMRQS